MIICINCGLNKSGHEVIYLGSSEKGQCTSCLYIERHQAGRHIDRYNFNCFLCKRERRINSDLTLIKTGCQMVFTAIAIGEKNFPK